MVCIDSSMVSQRISPTYRNVFLCNGCEWLRYGIAMGCFVLLTLLQWSWSCNGFHCFFVSQWCSLAFQSFCNGSHCLFRSLRNRSHWFVHRLCSGTHRSSMDFIDFQCSSNGVVCFLAFHRSANGIVYFIAGLAMVFIDLSMVFNGYHGYSNGLAMVFNPFRWSECFSLLFQRYCNGSCRFFNHWQLLVGKDFRLLWNDLQWLFNGLQWFALLFRWPCDCSHSVVPCFAIVSNEFQCFCNWFRWFSHGLQWFSLIVRWSAMVFIVFHYVRRALHGFYKCESPHKHNVGPTARCAPVASL